MMTFSIKVNLAMSLLQGKAVRGKTEATPSPGGTDKIAGHAGALRLRSPMPANLAACNFIMAKQHRPGGTTVCPRLCRLNLIAHFSTDSFIVTARRRLKLSS